MAGKVHIKAAVIIFLCFGIFIILSACMDPVDLDTFFKEGGKVDNYINNSVNKPSVPIVDDKTGDNLKGVKGKIEGLKNNKYYMVEKEVDAGGEPVNEDSYPKYVTEYGTFTPGQLVDDLGVITRISGGNIIGLTDSHTYTVRAATSFFDGLPFTYSDSSGVQNKAVPVNNGTITLPAPKGNITLEQLDALFNGYDVIGVAVRPAAFPSASPFYNAVKKTISGTLSSFNLEGADTEVDYVFVKPDVPANFYVLRVKIEATPPTVISDTVIQGVTAPVTGATPVSNITPSDQYTGTIVWSPNVTGTFAGGQVYTATITITPKTGYTLTGVAANSFTVSGATVLHVADSGVITAAFPATEIEKGNVTITFTISDASISGAGNPSPVSYNDIAGGTKTLTFTLTGGTYTSVTWTMGGVTASGGSNTGLTINSSSNLLPYLVSGTHHLYVNGTKDGVAYSAYIEFTVNN